MRGFDRLSTKPLAMTAGLGALVAAGFVALPALSAFLGSDEGTGPNDRVLNDFMSISAAMKMYRIHGGSYPTTSQGLTALVHRPADHPKPEAWRRVMDRIPPDPWGREYLYLRLPDSDPEGFQLVCTGADGCLGTDDDRSSLDRR
jgi:general secretion pathway protein G